MFSQLETSHRIKFEHEETQQQINLYRKLLKEETKRLKEKQFSDIAYDLKQLWALYEGYANSNNSGSDYVTFYINKPLTIEEWDKVYEDIDVLCNQHNRKFDERHTKVLNEDGETDMYLAYSRLIIRFAPSNCERVATGKMVPEYKNKCAFYKD